MDGLRVRYAMESNGGIELLDDFQWADWSQEGHLLAALRSGQLQIQSLEGHRPTILFEADLSNLEPNPMPAPQWAQQW